MISVQSDGCAPIERAFERGERFATPWQDARTTAWGIRVPAAVGDFMILDAVRESGGCAVAVAEAKIEPMRRRATAAEGIAFCPETAACLAAVPELLGKGAIRADERVVVFNTAAAVKYLPTKGPELRVLSAKASIDYATL